MAGSAHKKKTDVELWEIVTTERKMPAKNKAKRQKDAGTTSGRSAKNLQIIGQGEAVRPIRENRSAPTARQRRTVSSAGQGRTTQLSRQSRPEQNYRQKRSPQAVKRRKAKRRQAFFYRIMAFAMKMLCLFIVCELVVLTYTSIQEWRKRDIIPVTKVPVVEETDITEITAPDITASYLDINDYSRPGTKLDSIESIFVHYTANPGTSAAQNRSYFANLAQTHERSASAHFIIGYEGEIIQCIPLEEQAYAVMTRNEDSISIECCYLEEDGEFTQATYDSLVHLLAWLIQEYDLEVGDILRHYDCGGKKCPLYYVENDYAWDRLLLDVGAYRQE